MTTEKPMSANYEFTHESLLRYLEGVRSAWEAARGNEIERLQREIEVLGDACRRRNERVDRLTAENKALRDGLRHYWGDKLEARLAYVLEQSMRGES
jgi:hypothetical protein